MKSLQQGSERMRKLILSLAATPLILGSIAVSANAAEEVAADAGFNIFSDVKFTGELRPRYQFTDTKTDTRDAGHQVTNRTNLNFTAKLMEVDGLNGTMELNAVNDFGTEQSSATAQVGGEALVAKISQANISYTAAGVTGIAGRKTVNLDNQRFIGSVGWKQNFQTLDLAAVTYGTGAFNILAAYVYGVNAIGDDGYDYGRNPEEKYAAGITSGRTNSAALNASYAFMNELKLTGYAYLLGSASDTYGASLTGNIAAGESVKLDYRAEVAMQSKATLKTFADGSINAGTPLEDSLYGDAMYANLDVGANISGFLAGLNYEYLGGADINDASTSQFQTPLATKHKFNGWADQFLSTPATGLTDLNVRGGYASKSVGKVLAVYHLFGAAADGSVASDVKAGDAYGQELDLLYTRPVPGVNGLNALIKGAVFMDDDKNSVKTSDVTMAWVQLDYKFATK